MVRGHGKAKSIIFPQALEGSQDLKMVVAGVEMVGRAKERKRVGRKMLSTHFYEFGQRRAPQLC